MILLLAVAIPALLGVVVVGAALAQRQYDLSLGADIAALRRRRAAVAYRLLALPANDTLPLMKIRRRADRSFRR
jgi:hypothetical protein